MLNLGQVIYGEDHKESVISNIRNFTGHSERVHSVAFSQNGILASSSQDKTINLWNVTTGENVMSQ